MVRFNTTQFFRIVQAALRSPATAPLSKSDLQLSRAFNRLFAAANIAAHRTPFDIGMILLPGAFATAHGEGVYGCSCKHVPT